MFPLTGRTMSLVMSKINYIIIKLDLKCNEIKFKITLEV